MALDTLLGVGNQRLLRKLCNECKQAYEPNKEILRKFNISAEKKLVFYRAGKVQYDKHGKPSTCDHCQGTGFYGRMCVFEIIMMSDVLRNSLKKAKSVGDIDNYVRSAKMLYLQEQALRKVMDGTTSINEIIRIFSGSQKPLTEQ
jgi:type II secretory ATPase GspE/PulE/Tfp pilus assembly ATPase PilB-like protein